MFQYHYSIKSCNYDILLSGLLSWKGTKPFIGNLFWCNSIMVRWKGPCYQVSQQFHMQVCNQRLVAWHRTKAFAVCSDLGWKYILLGILWNWTLFYSECDCIQKCGMCEWQRMDREMLLLHVLSLFTMVNPLTASGEHLDIHNQLSDDLLFGKKWKSDLRI